MANNSIQSAVAIADAHVVSDKHCGRGFYQRLARRARIFPSNKNGGPNEKKAFKRLFQAIVASHKRLFGAGAKEKKSHQSGRIF